MEQQFLDQVLPSELDDKTYKKVVEWVTQPFYFFMGLSYKTQIYFVLLILLIWFVVIPLFRYLLAKLFATCDPLRFSL